MESGAFRDAGAEPPAWDETSRADVTGSARTETRPTHLLVERIGKYFTSERFARNRRKQYNGKCEPWGNRFAAHAEREALKTETHNHAIGPR